MNINSINNSINSINTASPTTGTTTASKLTETEKKYDADGDGVLSEKEKAAMLAAEAQNTSSQLTQDKLEISDEARQLYNATTNQ
ncbi:MAG: hypothetical protein LBK98_03060 [Peptococcaceae bacterium]|nr:hypothetical protein [Peptococcaceae bacterium]